jgi:TIR domain
MTAMMAFVPGCEHDVFVSYAHVDDLPFPGADKGWVTTLVETLRILLAQKLGRSDAYSLWMDHQLSRHKNLTPEILQSLQHSATLLVILSPGYLASEWCLREKDSFLDSLATSPLAGSRVFIIERDKVEREERPPQFADLLGYRFWVQEGEGQPPLILGVPRPDGANPRHLRYFDELARCSSNLADELKSLRQATAAGDAAPQAAAGDAAPQAAAAAEDERPAVFLAEATDDLDEDAGALRRGLDQAGLRVLPETWYPRDPEQFRRAVDEDLARSRLFVQLLSALPGKKPPGMPEGYVRAQHERAVAAGKPVLQWRSRKLDPATVEDATHRALLEGETVMAVGLEEFRSAVVERAVAPPQPEPEAAAEPGESLVFVDADSGDLALAAKVGEDLERRGLAFSLPLPGGTPAEVREDLEQNLLFSDALVIVWGGATARWVRNQLLMLRKVAWKRQRPLKAVALVVAPPAGKEPLGLGLPNLLTLDCQAGLGEGSLDPVVAALGPSP